MGSRRRPASNDQFVVTVRPLMRGGQEIGVLSLRNVDVLLCSVNRVKLYLNQPFRHNQIYCLKERY
jgi:hypothetical protein